MGALHIPNEWFHGEHRYKEIAEYLYDHGEELGDEHVDQLVSRLSAVMSKINEESDPDRIKDLEKEVADLEEEIEDLEEDIEDLKKESSEWEDQASKLESKVSELEEKIHELEAEREENE